MKRRLRVLVTVIAETDCEPVGVGSYEHQVRYTHDAVKALLEAESRFWQTRIDVQTVDV